ncbi:MAG TPA: sulfur carrier protein ThiS [Terriglobia bacterium]|nr:sulfur carrier protein ThiS [Terriglobia bacterium]
MEVEILLNGEGRKVRGNTRLTILLEDLHLDLNRVAVEYNRKLLKREKWGSTILADGDRIEIVHFVGGGIS